MFDLFVGKIDLSNAAAMFKGVDTMLKREDQHIAREEMALQANLRGHRAKVQRARHKSIER
jgi:hypothetical protein